MWRFCEAAEVAPRWVAIRTTRALEYITRTKRRQGDETEEGMETPDHEHKVVIEYLFHKSLVLVLVLVLGLLLLLLPA
ncbi:hypothetical protein E2C01_071742 [Portunus trituberculatus]|uniref:Uncharacterized protein n=1 Tax=Portunus trituberculatus TaxID=210409 RepID=A0A5B7HW33_PORTR|nr:hypothetical protein [Portunus trituberculatus]